MSQGVQLEETVRAAIAGDQRVTDRDVAILAHPGVVTLRGTVESFMQARAAVKVARSVPGVEAVYDQMKVRLLPGDARDDELRGVALQSLIADPRVPDDDADVHVTAGWVTLSGRVTHQSESDAAFGVVAGLSGVGGITNAIKVIAAPLSQGELFSAEGTRWRVSPRPSR